MSDDTYLIWSIEHNAWWRAGGWGYGTGLNSAGHFTRDQAIEICRTALPTSKHIGMISEVPVRLVDMQEVTKHGAPAVIFKSKNE